MKNIYERLIDFYGAEEQENQCIEECAELIQAINKKHRGLQHNIAEEIADVMICVEQLILINDCYKDVKYWKINKMKRALERIEQ